MPVPGAGSIILTVLDILSKNAPKDPNIFWHRMVESWKFGFGKKAQMSGPIFTEKHSFKFIYDVRYSNLISNTIDDSRTFNDLEHYYGFFDAIEDGGTGHINVLAPNGDCIAATSTINWGYNFFNIFF